MRFDRESWRKLYVAESAEHAFMPLAVRGVRDYLLRFAAEDGTLLPDTKDVVPDLAFLIRAKPAELDLVALIVSELQRVGYLKLTRGRLWMPRYEDAQAARSPGAKRQAAYKARKAGGGDDGSGGASPTPSPQASPGDVSGDASGDVTNEETRRDETRTTKPPVVLVLDSDSETMCPTDMVSRLDAAGVFKELSEKLGNSVEDLKAEADKVAGYWVFGKGAGKKRRNWAGIFRQWIVDKSLEGKLAKAKNGTDPKDDTGGYGSSKDWG